MVRMDLERTFPPKLEQYLIRLAAVGLKYRAAEEAGVAIEYVRLFRQRHADFREEEARALQKDAENLEQVARSRAVEGWDEHTITKSATVLVGADGSHQPATEIETKTVHKFDNSLLLALLRAKSPEFREKATIDVNVQAGVLVVPAPILDLAEWEKGRDIPTP